MESVTLVHQDVTGHIIRDRCTPIFHEVYTDHP